MKRIYFCDVIDGTRNGIKATFNAITGNGRLRKRGLAEGNIMMDIGPATTLSVLPAFGVLMYDALTSPVFSMQIIYVTLGIVAAGGVGIPLACHQISSAYRASAYDKKQNMIAAEKAKPALPPPTPGLT